MEQMQSLLNQTQKPDEVVICDDCSQDSTVLLVQEFIRLNALDNWKLHINEFNMGYVNNFKKAMMLTAGDIVFLCDQDDIWCSDKIQRMTEQMERDPKILALASNYQLVDQNGEFLNTNLKYIYQKPEKNEVSVDVECVKQGRVLYSNIAQGCTCAYRRKVLLEYCKTGGSVLPHDWAANMIAYRDGGLYFMNSVLTLYRLHENNQIGIPGTQQGMEERSSRLTAYLNCVRDARNLPLGTECLQELENIVAFTNIRIAWLKKKKIGIWMRGAVCHFRLWVRYFWKSYNGDLIFGLYNVISGKRKHFVE